MELIDKWLFKITNLKTQIDIPKVFHLDTKYNTFLFVFFWLYQIVVLGFLNRFEFVVHL